MNINYDHNDLNQLVNSYRNRLEEHNKHYSKNRTYLSYAKSAIFAMHRHEKSKALKILNELEQNLKSLFNHWDLTIDYFKLYHDFMEEFFEAELFYGFLYNNELRSRSYFLQFFENGTFFNSSNFKQLVLFNLNKIYIGALSDFSGELVRLAVTYGIKHNKDDFNNVINIKEVVELIYSFLIKCNITGDLRRKFDSIRWNLDKINDILLRWKD